MIIKQKLTKVNFTDKNDTSRIEYIVIHYTGNDGDTALNNANYFYSEYRGASAHYFVDENEIYQVVEDGDIAWHCGTSGTYCHPSCRNTNSIGVEMCNFISINDAVMVNTIELVKSLMSAYNVPVENIIRHYDVTGKICPLPYVNSEPEWENFLAQVSSSSVTNVSIEDCTQELLWRGIIAGKELWNAKAAADEDLEWFLTKYYSYIMKNGGSVKEPISVSNSDEAINILKNRGIISDAALWAEKSTADEDIFWLLVKTSDYIN